ncbi:hypothetical protein EV702DRAFT_700000 [Suillus placidus]|uniref:Secreted protein n=1 Tax=Suillus placidus TaxID=48579 RepID=A0A9P6ZKV3_9AGAM|nr:hypothetical protein EV702DRAFT_700000 [Suillus placidus]
MSFKFLLLSQAWLVHHASGIIHHDSSNCSDSIIHQLPLLCSAYSLDGHVIGIYRCGCHCVPESDSFTMVCEPFLQPSMVFLLEYIAAQVFNLARNCGSGQTYFPAPCEPIFSIFQVPN